MADALSRIRTQVGELSEEDRVARQIRKEREEFDEEDIHTFNVNESHVSVSLVQLDEEFKKEISESYESDIHFGPIWNILTKYVEEYEDRPIPEFLGRPRSPYKLMNSKEHPLIFYEDTFDQRLRLCIPYKQLKEILRMAHDQENHHGIEKTYARAIAGFFAPPMFRQVKSYIGHCPKCVINRTLRHKPHGETRPISKDSDEVTGTLIVAKVDKYMLKDGVSHRQVKEGIMAPYIDFQFRGDLMQRIHDQYGHLSYASLINVLESWAWWPTMERDLHQFV